MMAAPCGNVAALLLLVQLVNGSAGMQGGPSATERQPQQIRDKV
jgi:hypothetical protein